VDLSAVERTLRELVEGGFQNSFFPPSAPAESLDKTQQMPSMGPVPTLASVILVTQDGQERKLVGGALRIGRGPGNDLVIHDVRVSRHHALIEPLGTSWVVHDLGSTNGTFVEGQRVHGSSSLDPPLSISLGGYTITLRSAESP